MGIGYDDSGQATDGGGDIIDGADGDIDIILSNGGDDTIEGGAGADIMDGGADVDTASYVNSDAAVNVDLLTGTGIGGHAEGDTLENFENLTGSAFDDTLTGGFRENVIDGGAGNDQIDGGAGSDTLVGGRQ
ncbi:MAG: calcium-binding protein [Halocynthiibacter sp.]